MELIQASFSDLDGAVLPQWVIALVLISFWFFS